MSKHSVEIMQILTKDSHVNVDAEEMGRIELSGNTLKSPTVLVHKGCQWHLVVFDDVEWMKEKLPAIVTAYNGCDVFRFTELGLIQCNSEGGLLHDPSGTGACRACKLEVEKSIDFYGQGDAASS